MSFKPTPLRGVVVSFWYPSVPASATLSQRRGLIQVLGIAMLYRIVKNKSQTGLLLLDTIFYALVSYISIRRYMNPRIEALTGNPYDWPIQDDFFALSSLLIGAGAILAIIAFSFSQKTFYAKTITALIFTHGLIALAALVPDFLNGNFDHMLATEVALVAAVCSFIFFLGVANKMVLCRESSNA